MSQVEKNRINGANFENVVGDNLAKKGHTDITPQITIKAANGVKTRVDYVSKDPNGTIVLTEAKASETAPLTANQKSGYPSIAESGGVVVGKGKPGFPGGTTIPPNNVTVARPNFILGLELFK